MGQELKSNDVLYNSIQYHYFRPMACLTVIGM